ncbi:MAG: hypothetical protein ACI97A_004253 [Planctomycetota bacterium]|jgi:hypothetical protein
MGGRIAHFLPYETENEVSSPMPRQYRLGSSGDITELREIEKPLNPSG